MRRGIFGVCVTKQTILESFVALVQREVNEQKVKQRPMIFIFFIIFSSGLGMEVGCSGSDCRVVEAKENASEIYIYRLR